MIVEYLRKELKVPEYSEMFDDKDLLKRETETLFLENPRLENKLEQIKTIVKCVRDTIKEVQDVHVSFGVYDTI